MGVMTAAAIRPQLAGRPCVPDETGPPGQVVTDDDLAEFGPVQPVRSQRVGNRFRIVALNNSYTYSHTAALSPGLSAHRPHTNPSSNSRDKLAIKCNNTMEADYRDTNVTPVTPRSSDSSPVMEDDVLQKINDSSSSSRDNYCVDNSKCFKWKPSEIGPKGNLEVIPEAAAADTILAATPAVEAEAINLPSTDRQPPPRAQPVQIHTKPNKSRLPYTPKYYKKF